LKTKKLIPLRIKVRDFADGVAAAEQVDAATRRRGRGRWPHGGGWSVGRVVGKSTGAAGEMVRGEKRKGRATAHGNGELWKRQ
jgi:hypothetical protein